jgi:hypothetical protein
MQIASGPIALMGTSVDDIAEASGVLSRLGANVWSMPPDVSPRDAFRLLKASGANTPSCLATVVRLEQLHAASRAWFEQVECSDVLLLVGAPMGEDLAVLQRLQPRATLLRLDDVTSFAQCRRFDPLKTPQSSGVYQALALGLDNEPAFGKSEVLACDRHVFAYRTTSAFDPDLWEKVERGWPAEVVRAFGCVVIGEATFVLEQMGRGAPELVSEGDEAGGSQLALIGTRLNADYLKNLLDSALVARSSSLRLLATRRRRSYGTP